MFRIRGYLTRTGAVFVTNAVLVNFNGVVADPGDVVAVDGFHIINYTKVRKRLPYVFPLLNTFFVLITVCH